MKVCNAINPIFPSRITSRPSWQTWMLMTDLRDFYFTLAFSLINNLMAFFFFCLFLFLLVPKRLWNEITFPNASESLEFIFWYFILMLVCCHNYCILIDVAKFPLAGKFLASFWILQLMSKKTNLMLESVATDFNRNRKRHLIGQL